MLDLVIIGAGPVGLSAAIEAKRQGLSYIVLEKGLLCNSIYHFPVHMRFFTTAELLEIGGHAFPSTDLKPSRQRTLDYYRRVTELENLNIMLHHEVRDIEKRDDFTITGIEKNTIFEYTARNIIIATGYFDNPVGLDAIIDDDARYSLRYQDPHQYFKQKVAVIGAGNSGAETALELYRHGAEVYLLHKGDKPRKTLKYWVGPDLENRLKNDEIHGIMPVKVTRLSAEGVHYEYKGEVKLLEVDFTLVLTGYTPNIDQFLNWKIPFDEESLVVTTTEFFETETPHMFVIGSAGFGRKTNSVFIENGREHDLNFDKFLQVRSTVSRRRRHPI